jgi:hypothetical protein
MMKEKRLHSCCVNRETLRGGAAPGATTPQNDIELEVVITLNKKSPTNEET